MIQLGHVYKDVVTGFTGYAIAYAKHLSGETSVQIQAKVVVPQMLPAESWFNIRRLVPIGGEPIVLNNGAISVPVKPAPKD